MDAIRDIQKTNDSPVGTSCSPNDFFTRQNWDVPHEILVWKNKTHNGRDVVPKHVNWGFLQGASWSQGCKPNIT